MVQTRPMHYDEANVKRLNTEITTALAIGGFNGLVWGIASYFVIGLAYPTIKKTRLPAKLFYFTIWTGSGAAYRADKQVILFSKNYNRAKEIRDQQLLEEAADQGIYTDNE